MNRPFASLLPGALALLLLTAAAYVPALRAGFIWDDNDHVTQVDAVQEPGGLARIWFEPGATCQYCPLTFSLFRLEYHGWGLRPAGYHAVNILLHGLNAVLLWLILRRLLAAGAWIAAALFAVHPVMVMSVAWITELKNVWSGLFYFLSGAAFLAAHGWFRAAAPPVRRGRMLYGLSVLLFLAALLAKSAAASLPVVLLLVAWWKRERLERTLLLRLLPFFGLAILMSAVTVGFEQFRVFVDPPPVLTLDQRLILAGHSFWFYLSKLVWPVRLSFIYPRWDPETLRGLAYGYPLAAALSLYVLWEARARIGRGPFAALLAFFIAGPSLILVHTLYMMQYTFVSDHWIYFAVVPLLVAVGWGIGRLPPLPRGLVVAVLLAALGSMSWARAHAYRDQETLWRDTLEKNPNCWLARNNLGVLLVRQGRLDEAIRQLEAAVRINPRVTRHQYNLGIALEKDGQPERAIVEYREALRLRPDYLAARRRLAGLLGRTGRPAQAEALYREGLKIVPNDLELLHDLGVVLMLEGKTNEAARCFREVLRRDPANASARANLKNIESLTPGGSHHHGKERL